jgi:hypothetical protein
MFLSVPHFGSLHDWENLNLDVVRATGAFAREGRKFRRQQISAYRVQIASKYGIMYEVLNRSNFVL